MAVAVIWHGLFYSEMFIVSFKDRKYIQKSQNHILEQ